MNFFKEKKLHTILVGGSVLLLLAVPIVHGLASAPGSEGDPIVSKSYVDSKVGELEEQVRRLTETANELSERIKQLNENPAATKFEIIRLTKGQQLTAGESAEIIVRRGRTEAISGAAGDGLSDITIGGGIDYYSGDIIPENHLLLVSRDDGRGLIALSPEVYLLIKGEYSVK